MNGAIIFLSVSLLLCSLSLTLFPGSPLSLSFSFSSPLPLSPFLYLLIFSFSLPSLHTLCFPYPYFLSVVEQMCFFIPVLFYLFNHPSLLCDVALSVAAKQWKKLKHGRLIATNDAGQRPIQKSREVR